MFHQPKFSANTMNKMKSMVTLSASYNCSLSEELEVKLKEHKITQASLVYLKFFPTAFKLITDALNKSVLSLPVFLWAYKLGAEMDEVQFIKRRFRG
jgi:hypothetical protein